MIFSFHKKHKSVISDRPGNYKLHKKHVYTKSFTSTKESTYLGEHKLCKNTFMLRVLLVQKKVHIWENTSYVKHVYAKSFTSTKESTHKLKSKYNITSRNNRYLCEHKLHILKDILYILYFRYCKKLYFIFFFCFFFGFLNGLQFLLMFCLLGPSSAFLFCSLDPDCCCCVLSPPPGIVAGCCPLSPAPGVVAGCCPLSPAPGVVAGCCPLCPCNICLFTLSTCFGGANRALQVDEPDTSGNFIANVEAWPGVDDDVVDGESKGKSFLPIFWPISVAGSSPVVLVLEGDDSRISLVGAVEQAYLANGVGGIGCNEVLPGYM